MSEMLGGKGKDDAEPVRKITFKCVRTVSLSHPPLAEKSLHIYNCFFFFLVFVFLKDQNLVWLKMESECVDQWYIQW